jgi:hypothetical protein
MFSSKIAGIFRNIDRPELNNFNAEDRGRYFRYILIFGIIFMALQISDLSLTHHGLNNNLREVNPLYYHDLFIPFKISMVLFIMAAMYQMPARSRGMAKNAMALMIFIYVFINLNNLYYILRT